jgi:hypothetical protein
MKVFYYITMFMIAVSAITDVYKLSRPSFQLKWLTAINIVTPIVVLTYVILTLKKRRRNRNNLKALTSEFFRDN